MKPVEKSDGKVRRSHPIKLPVREVDEIGIPLHLNIHNPGVEVRGGGVNGTTHSALDKQE